MAPKRLRDGSYKQSAGVSKGVVRSMIRNTISSKMEHQHYISTASGTAIVAGNMSPITQALIQGDGVNQRDGDVIHPELVNFKLFARASPANIVMQAATAYRVILFQDNLNVGVAPVTADVVTASSISQYDVENLQQNRFKILYDKTHAMTAAYASNAAIVIDVKIPVRGKIFYNGTSNATASNGKGSMWLLTLTDNATSIVVAEIWAIDLKYTDA